MREQVLRAPTLECRLRRRDELRARRQLRAVEAAAAEARRPLALELARQLLLRQCESRRSGQQAALDSVATRAQPLRPLMSALLARWEALNGSPKHGAGQGREVGEESCGVWLAVR